MLAIRGSFFLFSPDQNVFDACVNGAWLAAKGGATILIMITGFLSLFYLFDAGVIYLGSLVGIDIQLHVST